MIIVRRISNFSAFCLTNKVHLFILTLRTMSSMYILCALLLLSCVQAGNNQDLVPKDITFLILSQKEGYHAAHAKILKDYIVEQAEILGEDPPNVILTHELNINRSWTIIPLVEYLSDKGFHSKWFFFGLENTVVRLSKLLTVLSRHEETKNQWIGYALYDQEPTIIHHFADHKKKFKYPHIASGFVISSSLMKSLAQKLDQGEGPNDDFTIDASYEFAKFVLNVDKNARLIHIPEISIVSSLDSATYPKFFHPCDSSVSSAKAYFAIKTCAKYHNDRIPAIQETWVKHATNIGYFSDAADKYLPEAFVGPNTTRGHCAKTYNILMEADRILSENDLNWLVISDDDTMFSVSRLMRLLTCYNPGTPVAIGERYGFRTWDNNDGYDYLTGGAGLVLSRPLVHRMVEPGVCDCPDPQTPDDMYLFGVCLARIGVQPVHSPLFHQADPLDYATAYLASQEPVSFHRFWKVPAKTIYDEWFAEADEPLINRHTEL